MFFYSVYTFRSQQKQGVSEGRATTENTENWEGGVTNLGEVSVFFCDITEVDFQKWAF